MSPKSFAVLAAVTAISLGLAAWAVAERDLPVTATREAQPMFAGLLSRLGEVETIRVTGGGESITLRRDGEKGGWRIEERGGYPADPQQVRELALALANLRLVEAKTAKEERLSRLELGDPAKPEAKSRQVELLKGDGTVLAAAVVGKTRYGLYGGGRSGVYVRQPGESQAWLAAGEIKVPGEPTELMDRQIVDLPEDQIGRVTLGVGGPGPITVVKADPAAESFSVQAPPLPEGRQADTDKLGRLAGTLSGLTMQDVRPLAQVSFPADAPSARFETWDGLAVDARVARIGEGDKVEHWVSFAVAATEPLPGAPLQPADARPAAERAAELKARLDGWAFRLPEHVASRIGWTMDSLLVSGDGTS